MLEQEQGLAECRGITWTPCWLSNPGLQTRRWIGGTFSLLRKGISQSQGDTGGHSSPSRQACSSVQGPVLPVPPPSPFWPVYHAKESVTEILMLPRHSNWHQLNCYIHVELL